MKKFIVTMICVLATTFSLSCFAEGDECEGKKGKRPDFSVLNIAEDKKERFEALVAKHRAEHKKLREANREKTDGVRSQMKALHEKHKAEMEEILTAEQFEKFEEMMKELKEHHKQKRKEKRSEQED